MYAVEMAGVLMPELRSDMTAPVAAGAGVAIEAEHLRHQFVKQISHYRGGYTGARQWRRKTVSRQRRDDNFEGICGIAAKRCGICQWRDDLAGIPEGRRPAVKNNQRNRVGAHARLAEVMNRHTVDVDLVMPKRVDVALGLAPVVIFGPVVRERAQIRCTEAVQALAIADIVGPARMRKAALEVVECGLFYIDSKRLRIHRAFLALAIVIGADYIGKFSSIITPFGSRKNTRCSFSCGTSTSLCSILRSRIFAMNGSRSLHCSAT